MKSEQLIIRREKWNKPIASIAAVLGAAALLPVSDVAFDFLFFKFQLQETFQAPSGWFILFMGLLGLCGIYVANITHQLQLSSHALQSGIHLPFRKTLLHPVSVTSNTLEKMEIKQTEDLYFNLIAKRKDGFEMLVERGPNSKPLQKRMEDLMQKGLHKWNTNTL